MIEIKITGDTALEVRDELVTLASLYGLDVPATTAPEKVAKADKPAKAPKATNADVKKAIDDAKIEAEPEKAEKPAASKPEKTEAPKAEKAEKPTTSEVDYADVQKAVVALAATKGRGAALEVLEQFGVDHASKVDEGKWGELLAALTDAATAEDA